MIRKRANKISRRYVLIALILVGLTGLFMFLVFMGYFLDVANGYPYMETKFGFLPEDLFEMAEGYGAAGAAYVSKVRSPWICSFRCREPIFSLPLRCI